MSENYTLHALRSFAVTSFASADTGLDSRDPSKVGALEAVEGHVRSCLLRQQRQQRDPGAGEDSSASKNMAGDRRHTSPACTPGRRSRAARHSMCRAHALPADARLHEDHGEEQRKAQKLYLAPLGSARSRLRGRMTTGSALVMPHFSSLKQK